jgi:hypothetical protein
MTSTPVLSDLLTKSQEKQFTLLLAEIMAFGFGSLEITIVEHQPRFFKYLRSIRATPGGDFLNTDTVESSGEARKLQNG